MVVDILTGNDKATISLSRKSRIVKLLHAKSASDFDGTNSPSRKRIFKYASLAMSTSPSKLSHFDHLINVLATYPAIVVITSALFLSRTLSTISCVLIIKNILNYLNALLIFRCKILFSKVNVSFD